jgi:hypothetical protein
MRVREREGETERGNEVNLMWSNIEIFNASKAIIQPKERIKRIKNYGRTTAPTSGKKKEKQYSNWI